MKTLAFVRRYIKDLRPFGTRTAKVGLNSEEPSFTTSLKAALTLTSEMFIVTLVSGRTLMPANSFQRT